MPRSRPDDTLRPVEIHLRFLDRQPSSVLYSAGATKVLCNATLLEGVPLFLEGSGKGWATAEYDLLPAATSPRHPRERSGKISGRTLEIQRLIGRALRGVLDLKALHGHTLHIDCDVLQADGGTRTAAINGAYVAASIAVRGALDAGVLKRSPFIQALAATSAGIVAGRRLLDLDYEEDSAADVDLNLVLAESGAILEIQATSEGKPCPREDLDGLVDLATKGIGEILERQRRALTNPPEPCPPPRL